MHNSKPYIAIAGLLAGFLLSSVAQRPRVDLNMDGAPPVAVPGYTGPIYDGKRKLVGYAQPKVVNLTPPPSVSAKMRASSPSITPHSTPRNLAANLKPLTLR